MPAGLYDIVAEQGATLDRVITWRNSAGALINLTSYTARMQVRSDYQSSTVVLNLTTENGGITLGGALGTITLTASATAMAAIASGTYVYDLEMVLGSVVTRLVQGSFAVNVEVTR
jgi:hypothetical protein